MKVRIDGVEYEIERNCNWIELILEETDKSNISRMPEGFKHYFYYSDNPTVVAEVDKRISSIKEEKENGDMLFTTPTQKEEGVEDGDEG